MATAATQRQETASFGHEFNLSLYGTIEGMVLIDQAGRIKLLSPSAARQFGCSETELKGQSAASLVAEVDRAAQERHIQLCLQAASRRAMSLTCEVTAERRDGTQFAAEFTVGQIPGSVPAELVAFVRDISERRRNEDVMRHSEAALQTAQELANIGNYVIHFDGNAEDYASPQLRRIFGWEPNESISNLVVYVQSVVHPSDRHRVVQAFTELYAGGGSFDIEYRMLHANTGLRYLHHIAQTIYSSDGRMLQQMGTVHDITERRLAEYEVRQMHDRLAHFGRISTMGEMAAAIAHEVNQPLAAIATFAQSCERLLSSDEFTREELSGSLGQIARQALRAGEIIRRLRSFSRHHEVQFELTHPNRLLDELLVLAQTDAHHHNVRIHLQPSAQLPQIRADALQVQQVLLNLVRNSIEAMAHAPEENREITLGTRLDERGDIEFMVADRGRGLDPQAAEELFRPFFTTKTTGTGLGLAISASIVRAHGGRLWCMDNPGGGARFLFSIPAVATDLE